MRARRLSLLALLGAALLSLAGSAQGAPGELDPSFGGSGTVTTAVGTDAAISGIALQTDGEIVTAGYAYNGSQYVFAVARYNANGSLDPSFGSGGVVTTAIGSSNDRAAAVAVQPDGKIVVAGTSYNGSQNVFAVARYNPDGSLDPSFGSGGTVTTAIGSTEDDAYAVALQPDGKIVVAGQSSSDVALVRYNPDGSLDLGFGTGGKVTITGSNTGSANAVAVQSDGHIFAVGSMDLLSTTAFGLAQFDSNGALVSWARTTIGGSSAAAALALQANGDIDVAGYAYNGSQNVFAVARYDSAGNPDPSFGSGGTTTTAIGNSDMASAITVQPDGKLLVAGSSSNGSHYEFALARYNADGSLDTSFGSGGEVTTSIGPLGGMVQGAVLQSDGKLVVAGWAGGQGDDEFALARYLGSTLTVMRAGNGSGTVSSSPAGIDCGTSCSAPFAAAPVTLTATPSAGSLFAGWSGGGCAGTGTCQVEMSADQGLTATFDLARTLTVRKSGRGLGTVTSSPAGIHCGSTCSYPYASGSVVSLTAKAARGSAFAGWSGACSGTGRCAVTMTQAQLAISTFAPAPACIVPRVTGRSLRVARRRIRRAHCRVGSIRRRYSKHAKNRVISERPRPARRLQHGARVDLVVSRGRP